MRLWVAQCLRDVEVATFLPGFPSPADVLCFYDVAFLLQLTLIYRKELGSNNNKTHLESVKQIFSTLLYNVYI